MIKTNYKMNIYLPREIIRIILSYTNYVLVNNTLINKLIFKDLLKINKIESIFFNRAIVLLKINPQKYYIIFSYQWDTVDKINNQSVENTSNCTGFPHCSCNNKKHKKIKLI